MSEVKRYYLTDDFIDGPAMEESPSGDYYKVSDIDPILVAARAVVEARDDYMRADAAPAELVSMDWYDRYNDALEALRAALDPVPGRTP